MPEKNSKFDSRLDQRNHKRKKNNILNILIGVVILLIIIVAINIVTGDDEKEVADPSTKTSELEEGNAENELVTEEEEDVESEDEKEIIEESTKPTSSNEDTTIETQENASTDTKENEAGTVTTEPSDDSKVNSVVIDSGWQPIGTKQTGEHVSSYTKGAVDWEEKVDALAYAANLDPSNMYVKRLGNGGSPQKSIGIVTSKDGSEIYRISLEWVDGEGWKPTKKEILKTLE
ncbi:YrrS family protein [Psychrobacillus antarcticus]|uniref:YrrS family protein n=1 Tax=Psychrobacillus antarcticus TaxID=2879115 RepID=UPI00240881BF|nr:YrrS family protein [Psychrobacillus antarcticus]